MFSFSLPKEEWKPVDGFEAYMVSNLGRMANIAKNRLLKTTKSRNSDYIMVGLSNGKWHTKRVHILVAEAFIGQIPKGFVVNHKDLNKGNNNINNLEVVTPRENSHHYFRSTDKSSKYIGVTWHIRHKKWVAMFWADSRHIFLGYYHDEREANRVYQKALELNEKGLAVTKNAVINTLNRQQALEL